MYSTITTISSVKVCLKHFYKSVFSQRNNVLNENRKISNYVKYTKTFKENDRGKQKTTHIKYKITDLQLRWWKYFLSLHKNEGKLTAHYANTGIFVLTDIHQKMLTEYFIERKKKV